MTSNRWQAACLAIFLAVAVVDRAGAVSISFTTQVGDQERNATVDIVERDRVSYVSLTGVAQQLGGRCTVANDRVEVDFGGGVAWVNRDDAQVNASFGRFALKHKVAVDGRTAFMALSDVVPFFGNAFRAKVSQGVPDETAAPVTPAAPMPQDLSPSPAPPPSTPPSAETPAPGVRVVAIDPGHGGSDNGAVGPAGLKEKDVTLSIANRMAKTLRDTYQVKATLTRAEDINLSPEKRASAANYNRGDVLVSIHTGTSAVSTAAGFQVFYASPAALVTRGKQAAKTSGAIAQAVAAELARSTSAASRGVREAPCRLFQGLAMPGILVELGPIGTASQEALLADDSHQQMIAQAIVTGLMNAVGAPKDSP